ncbi:MAG: hypothetical protein ABSD27_01720 [Bryobacteraceae bacterium]|jgi:hypothetical protein
MRFVGWVMLAAAVASLPSWGSRQALQARELKLGDRFGQDVEVLEGLDSGEQVATSQVTRLDSGVRVRVAGPAASPE